MIAVLHKLRLILLGVLVAFGTAGVAQVGGGSGISAPPTRDASLLTTGELADARLSPNVPLLDQTNSFTAFQMLSYSDARLVLNDTVATAGEQAYILRSDAGDFFIYPGVVDASNSLAGTPGAIVFYDRSAANLGLQATSITANGNRIHKTARAFITGIDGSVSLSYGVTSGSKPAAGEYDINLTAAGFTATPICTVTPATLERIAYIPFATLSATNLTYVIESTAGTPTDTSASFICVGF